MRKRIVLAATLVAILAAVALAVENPTLNRRFTALHPHTEPQIAAVAASMSRSMVRAEGRLAPYPGAEVAVSAERRGILDTLAVNERQMVGRGQRIGQLRAHDLEAQMVEQRARLREIQADVHLFEAEAERYQKLFDAGVGTHQAQQKAQRDLDLAQARLGTQRSVIDELQAELDKTRILAPISGMVLTRARQQGESVEAGETILTVADLKRVRIEAEVNEADLAGLKLHAPVSIRAEGFDRSWRGHVEEIPDQVEGRKLKPEDPGRPTDTRVLLVKVAFDEAHPLKLGQRVEVEF